MEEGKQHLLGLKSIGSMESLSVQSHEDDLPRFVGRDLSVMKRLTKPGPKRTILYLSGYVVISHIVFMVLWMLFGTSAGSLSIPGMLYSK